MSNRSIKISSFIILTAIIIFLFIVFYPDFSSAALVEGKIFKAKNITEWINQVYLWSAGAIGILAVAAVVFGGIQYTASIGSQEAITQAKTKIFAGLTGLVLVLLSWTILHTIDPRLVKIGFEVEKLNLQGQDIKGITIVMPPEEITAASPEDAANKCAAICKGKGTPRADKTTTEGKYTCTCEGATAEVSCTNDADCEKICREQKGEEVCKKLNIYCAETAKGGKGCKYINRNTEPSLLADGKSCKKDAQCQSGKCADGECGKPLASGHCENNSDCQSGKCYTAGRNECVPVGGFEAGHGCQLENQQQCASGMCIDRRWLVGDECARVEGNLEGEPCNSVYHSNFNLNNCNQKAGLYCEPESGWKGFGTCRKK